MAVSDVPIKQCARIFWDIESLNNVFSIACYSHYPDAQNEHIPEYKLDLFVLLDKTNNVTLNKPTINTIINRTREHNHNWPNNAPISVHNLADPREVNRLAWFMGLSAAKDVNASNDSYIPNSNNPYIDNWRPVCDTDDDYDARIHPYIMGYNSQQYDMTMLAIYFSRIVTPDKPQSKQLTDWIDTSRVTAHDMRRINDDLFTPYFKSQMAQYLIYEREINEWRQADAQVRNWPNPSAEPFLKKRQEPGYGYNSYAYRIRRSWTHSGRHVDVMRLNEKSHDGLKRLLGSIGAQILESDKLSGTGENITVTSTDELADLLAYNASDVINLETLFEHPFYQGQFELKRGLMKRYPELIYDRDIDATGTYDYPIHGGKTTVKRLKSAEPIVDKHHVRRDRIKIDSRSAQFATKALCPYTPLNDIDTVSFSYPSIEHVKDVGRDKPFNVLAMARDMIESLYPKDSAPVHAFMQVYKYYSKIAGCNFNDSDRYQSEMSDSDQGPMVKRDYPNDTKPTDWEDEEGNTINPYHKSVKSLREMSASLCIPYYDNNGNPTSCFAVFSTGGIHGQEFNEPVWNSKADEARKETALFEVCWQQLGVNPSLVYKVENNDPSVTDEDIEQVRAAVLTLRKSKTIDIADPDTGETVTYPYKTFIKSGMVIKRPETHHFRLPTTVASQFQDKRTPCVFVKEVTNANATERGIDIPMADGTTQHIDIDYTHPTLSTSTTVVYPVSIHGDDSNQQPLATTARVDMLSKQHPHDMVIDVTDSYRYIIKYQPMNGDDAAMLKNPRWIPKTEYAQSNFKFVVEERILNNELKKAYNFTSMDATSHEDFTSYYPNMLRMMSAFYNRELGYDRYEEIFMDKERFGKLRKDKSLSADQRAFYSVQREGTKLILNSASGAGDTKADYHSPIQMNNRIISMRLIGQLFSWMIGQYQAYHGAKITSTNTDGLYSAMPSRDENNRLLAEKSADIGVPIEPEPMILISKDANNRIELTDPAVTGKPIEILTASGGSLSCFKDTSPTKSLAHAAILDTMTAEYLKAIAKAQYEPQNQIPTDLDPSRINLTSPADPALMREFFDNALAYFDNDLAHTLRMMGTMCASSPSSHSYMFATDELLPDPSKMADTAVAADIKQRLDEHTLHILQHYNRAFFVKEDTAQYWRSRGFVVAHMYAVAPMINTKSKNGSAHAPGSAQIFCRYEDLTALPDNKHVIVRKISGIDPEALMLIYNKSLDPNNGGDSAELKTLLNSLDAERYVSLAVSSFDTNWRNALPEN